MRRPARIRLTLFLTLMAWLVVVVPAQAYIDPASTSLIFSALIAGVAAVGTGIAMFWSRVVGFFRRDGGGDTGDEA